MDTRAIKTGELDKEPFPDATEEFRIHVAEEAFDLLTERGSRDLTREVGGVLVGRVLRDESGPYVRVDALIEALHADEKATELTFTHATWDHIHKEMDSRYEGKSIVGWAHTHPGFGIFLSDRDQFIHQSFFNLPHQVALVYDPKTREHGVFAWRDGEPIRWRRYWVGQKEHVWDGPRTSAPVEKIDKTEEIDDADREREEAKTAKSAPGRELDLPALAFAGVLLLLVGGFVGWWFGRSGANEVVAEAQKQLDQARLSGARDAARMLDAELLAYVRASLGGEAIRKPLADAISDLDESIAKLPEGDEAREGFQAVRARLAILNATQVRAELAMMTLERLSRSVNVDTRELARSVREHRSALGLIYAELAADVAAAGDRQRASRLLRTAIQIDPGGAPRYEMMREALEKEEDR